MADLARLRDDLGAFSVAVGLPLTDWQVRSLGLEQRTTVVVAPRQSGKSRSLAVLAVWSAFRRAGVRVLVVSAGEEGAKRLLAEVRSLVTGSPLLAGSVTDETASLVTLSNGSELRSVPASERQVRGWTVDLLLCDEASLISDDLLLGAALPTTAARPDARIVLASSASVASGSFYDFAVRGERGSEHVVTHRWSLEDATWISPSAVAAARDSMTPQRFGAEFLGVFASGADSLFTREALERATVDYLPESLHSLRGPARLLGGIDWGARRDRSALIAVGRLAVAGGAVFAVAAAHAWPAGHSLVDVVSEIAGLRAHFHRLSVERTGLGEGPAQLLARAWARREAGQGGGRPSGGHIVVQEGAGAPDLEEQLRRRRREARRAPAGFHTQMCAIDTSAQLKAASYGALRMAVERGVLLIPSSATELRRELLLLRVTFGERGSEHIHAASGHDDLSDALMLATGPYRARDGRWRTVLGDLTSPGVVHPDPPPLLAPGGTVSLPDGRTVGRRPSWLSVAGPELSAPPGADVGSEPDWVVRVRAAAGHDPKEVHRA